MKIMASGIGQLHFAGLAGFALAVVAAGAGCGSSSGSNSDLGNSAVDCGASMDGGCGGNSAYPAGPYGNTPGSVIADLTLRVQTGATGLPADKKLSDYRAQYLAGNLKVLAIFGAAEWCGPCKSEQAELIADYSQYQMKNAGVAFLDAVTQKNDQTPSDDTTVANWATAFKVPFDLASDPHMALASYFDASSFPEAMVIRLSDMQITALWTGATPGRVSTEVDSALK